MSARKKELQSNTITPWLWLSLTCVLFFLILVIAVRQPAVQALDQALIKSLDPIRTPSMVAFFSRFTDFATGKLLSVIIAVFMVYLLLYKRYLSVIILPLFFLLERRTNVVLKDWVIRDRPPMHHLVHESGYSFPSGHAMNASTVYGLLILLVLPLIKRRWIRVLWVVLGFSMILLVGFSRPLLRVHYFTDILAGYCAGGFFVGLSAMFLIYWNKKTNGVKRRRE
ncbi:phosphatase PAP2 family protein [Sporolactobacillus inulinus]|nr:phosphatase PAP2 family protein [Sporolactobacillus inulinus]GEB76955.1 putative lipid phosphate phosphatase YodM [Sporolactobacillus inulinus]